MKVKEFFQKIKIDKITAFVKKNARYFGAAAVFVAMVLILARCTDGTASDKDPMAGAYQQYAESDNQEVNDLSPNTMSIMQQEIPIPSNRLLLRSQMQKSVISSFIVNTLKSTRI